SGFHIRMVKRIGQASPDRIFPPHTHGFGKYRAPIPGTKEEHISLGIRRQKVDIHTHAPVVAPVVIIRCGGSPVLAPVTVLQGQMVSIKIHVAQYFPSTEVVLKVTLSRADQIISHTDTRRKKAASDG